MHWQSDVAKSTGQERFTASSDPITCALFAPFTRQSFRNHPSSPSPSARESLADQTKSGVDGMFVILADTSGRVRVYENDITTPKPGSIEVMANKSSATALT
jgi:hypothetical protein